MSEQDITSQPAQDENQIMAERRQKLTEIRTSKGVAFPNDFRRQHLAAPLHAQYDATDKEALEARPVEVVVAGRMMLKRVMGKASFATVQDSSGRIQFYISRDKVGEDVYAGFKTWDMGDILGAKGTLMKTKTGELSVEVSELRLLSKSLRPLPDKFHGLADQEQKYRQRYVDLIINQDSRDTFIKRSKIVQTVREVMVGEDYLEVETPMMHPIPGGAAAKPFVTHHNALDMPLYLRIAPELYLKRLVVGGLERVFEINRNFRNEGMSTRHNPEFTMIEFYEAYCGYERMMEMTEKIIRRCAEAACGTTTVTYNGKEVDLGKPFDRFTIVGAIKHYNPQYTDEQLADEAWLKSEIKALGGKLPPAPGIGSLQLALFEECAEGKLWNPTFIIDYPVEVSPLARGSDADPSITERFELFIVGREHANGYSELNDPEDQAARFRSQVEQKDAGDDEAMHYDADYIRAMEYGLPPTGGCGIGIDRLVMLLTDAPSIRDVILFPHMRPE
ncbi:lysine--tRNA ligase [Laribacter hongkongensis]|uniref:Lysine--tRNA ligase n=1 Tax=Laribacter hongkongensis TaxID=168471 RepID=A0ABD4SQV3_9NEIS|nr:lysine--tRNA ligase [Laribacter hongkongensis]MCG9025587.1 lysine--tRNA ligase [Laribacter hongkongensis]MCG9100146.1 lysine--tRNA ligase [Laribacter hongkongensis]MCG9102561.1 lysine--tRNA ligase [Laribacter hongkongensis]MCG9114216.1 lysine--tRNA ligase [Laribacter hongkongensis]MCG9119914.1 lysine--tRNA ligase [Laribacter hongkongensis]